MMFRVNPFFDFFFNNLLFSGCGKLCKLKFLGTVPVIGLYEVKVSKLSEALNKNF